MGYLESVNIPYWGYLHNDGVMDITIHSGALYRFDMLILPGCGSTRLSAGTAFPIGNCTLVLSTEHNYFIGESGNAEAVAKWITQPRPSLQLVISEQLDSPFYLLKHCYRNPLLLDLDPRHTGLTPTNTVGVPGGRVYFLTDRMHSSRKVQVYNTLHRDIIDYLVSDNPPSVVLINCFSCRYDRSYPLLHSFLGLFEPSEIGVLVGNGNEKLFNTQLRSYRDKLLLPGVPISDQLIPSEQSPLEKSPLGTLPRSFVPRLKGVIRNTNLPPDSCLPLGGYTRILEGETIGCLEEVRDGDYGVVIAEHVGDPRGPSAPIQAMVTIKLDRLSQEPSYTLSWGSIPDGKDSLLLVF